MPTRTKVVAIAPMRSSATPIALKDTPKISTDASPLSPATSAAPTLIFAPRVGGPKAIESRTASSSALQSTTKNSLQVVAAALNPESWRDDVKHMSSLLLLVLRSACASVLFAWAVMFCFSLGDIFGGRSVRAQSSLEFLLSNLLWWKFFNWTCVGASFASPLVTQRFANRPDAKPTFIVCWFKVQRGTYRLASCTTVVEFMLALALLHVPASVRKLRLHFYVLAFWHHVDTVACMLEATRIFSDETVRGQEKQRAGAPPLPRYWTRFVRAYLLSCVGSFSPYLIAAIYTHVTSSIVLATQLELVLFACVSFGVKIALQEAAKLFVFEQKVQSVTTMAAVVGIPTILIDTQARIVLLCANSTSTTLSGTLVMIVVEIAFRCGKSMHIKWSINRERVRRVTEAAATAAAATPDAPPPPATTTHSSKRPRTPRRTSVTPERIQSTEVPAESPATTGLATTRTTAERSTQSQRHRHHHEEDFDKWCLRLLHYHACEVYTDMFAEYVALGCSYVIVFICWNHPKYMLRRFHDSVHSGNSTASSDVGDDASDSQTLSSILSSSNILIMTCQLGVEIAVDFASCLLEIHNGIDFRPLQRQSFYLAVLLMWAATANASISANMLVRVDE